MKNEFYLGIGPFAILRVGKIWVLEFGKRRMVAVIDWQTLP